MLPFCQEFLWQPFSITNSQCLILPLLPFSTRFSCLCRFAAAVFRISFRFILETCGLYLFNLIYLFLLCTVICVCCPSPLPPMNDHVFVALFSLTLMFVPPPLRRFCSFSCSFLFRAGVFVRACARLSTCEDTRGVWRVSGTPLVHNRRVFCPLPICPSPKQGDKTREERRGDYLSQCGAASQCEHQD